ncbi:MAG: Pr6Pr family membrane protein [Patescibacteria group bacterium]
MNKHTLVKLYRPILAAAGIAAIITDLFHGITSIPGFSVVNYFSFFTILSTLFTSIILLFVTFKKDVPLLRGGATLFMLITGIIYFLLLRNEPIEIAWVNAVFHYILPAMLLIDWLLNPPVSKISFSKAFLWLLFPALFFAYSLTRGFFSNWYPYPFMNVAEIGYAQTFINAVFVGLGMASLVLLVNAVHRLRLRMS